MDIHDRFIKKMEESLYPLDDDEKAQVKQVLMIISLGLELNTISTIVIGTVNTTGDLSIVPVGNRFSSMRIIQGMLSRFEEDIKFKKGLEIVADMAKKCNNLFDEARKKYEIEEAMDEKESEVIQ